MVSKRFVAAVAILAISQLSGFAFGAPPPAEILDVDLEPGIRAGAQRPERFAVDVPLGATTATHGSWSRANGVSTWRYSVRIPTAVSMSFHAGEYQLPAGAELKVSGGAAVASYRASDTGPSGLWSRVWRGDSVAFELTVPQAQEAQVRLTITSLQAGYRGLGGGVQDHPLFKKMQAATAAAGCIENFSCHENAANFGPRNATGAITVGGITQCTATVISNVRGDAKPYLLTARHCQVSGVDAANVRLYLEAAVPCAAALVSIYDSPSGSYFGGGTRTVFEQQDVWLIEFGPGINSAHPYFAGWDATGGTFIGGYSPHHALGRSRQYAGWFGQAFLHDISNSALGSGYRGTFWAVVNETGSVGSGASGGGLFDRDNRLVGTGSLANLPGGSGASDGICPLSNPAAPTGTNSAAEFNALSAVWDTTADTTSSTNPVTLKSILDPDNTGTKVVDGFELMTGPFIYAVSTSATSGIPLHLTWSAPGATSCKAEGGLPGDGWSGNIALSGSIDVNADFDGEVTYVLRCTDGTRKSYFPLRIRWTQRPADSRFTASPGYDLHVTEIKRFSWNSNVQPCVASGGVAGDGWAGNKAKSGEQDVVMSKIGPMSYTLTCGSGSRISTLTHTTNTGPPVAYLQTLGFIDNLRVGQSLRLIASGIGNCVRSGGSAGDGWSGSSGEYVDVTANAPGTYTYTLACSGDGQTATATVTRHFNNSAAFATLNPSVASAEVGRSGVFNDFSQGSYINLTWNSNLPSCVLRYAGPGTIAGTVGLEDGFNTETRPDLQYVAGIYTYTLTCKGGGLTATATSTVEWRADHPYIYFFAPSTMVANQGSLLSWQSNVFPCVADGGAAGDGWAGAKADAQGSSAVVETQPGTYNFGITCGASPGPTQRQVGSTVVPNPSVTVTANASHLPTLFFNSLSWSATTSPCVLSSTFFNADWTGSQFASGRASVNQQVAGTYTYTATCGPPGAQVTGSTTVEWEPSPFPTSEFSADKLTAPLYEPITLSWISNGTNYCTGSANTQVNDWGGVSLALSGSKVVTRTFPGTVTYYLECNGTSRKEVKLTFTGATGATNPFIPPAVTLSADKTQALVGENVTLTWAATHSSECLAMGGEVSNSDGWVGALAFSASQTVTERTPGLYRFFVVCSGAPPAAQAQVEVSFLAPASTPSGGGKSSSGKSGGGRLDWLLLLLLAAAAMTRIPRRALS